jgi:hypothetical protein
MVEDLWTEKAECVILGNRLRYLRSGVLWREANRAKSPANTGRSMGTCDPIVERFFTKMSGFH